MSNNYRQWLEDIILDSRFYPQGFVLNPRGKYKPVEQSSRRRAAYYLQRQKQIRLIQSPKKGNTRPIIVLPYTDAPVDIKNAPKGIYNDPKTTLRSLIDKHSFISWVATNHKTKLKLANSEITITVQELTEDLHVTQPRVSQLLKEYAAEEAENIQLYRNLLERQQAEQQA